MALAAPACSSSSNIPPNLYVVCAQNSDCNAGLICALGLCRPRCKTIADCSNGGSCIFDSSGHAVCQSPAENNTSCDVVTSPCKPPLACASDVRCRNLCAADANCNVLGITGRVCATDATGAHYCADPQVPGEVSGGKIVEPPPLGGGNGSGSGGGTLVDSGANDGSNAAIPCPSTCTIGKTCVGGACVACGTPGAPCCDMQQCQAFLTCTSGGTCVCGGANETCCGGTTCNSGLSCTIGDAGGNAGPTCTCATCACGDIGQRCCAGADGGSPKCNGGLACQGSKCGCLVEYATINASGNGGSSPGVVRRVDGTIWANNMGTAFAEMTGPSGPLRAPIMAGLPLIAGSGAPQAVPIACAVVGTTGNVWCFPSGGTLSDSTFLGAGLGPTDTTTSPVQVLMSTGGGTPLVGVQQIVGGPAYANFCAVTMDKHAWCWGSGTNGVLGNGGTSNSSFASQVMADASTPFANVEEVRLGQDSTCARKTDGTVWCWGANGSGELGVPRATLAQSLYPVQVPFLGGSASQRMATRLAAGPSATHCAIMADTSVVCWGLNNNAQAGAFPADAGAVVGPTSILAGASGTLFTGAVDLAGNGQNLAMCAKNSSFDVVCWGTPGNTSTPYPVAYKNSAGTAASGITALLSADYAGLGYIDSSGLLFSAGSSTGPQPPCTNLLP